MVSKTKFAEIVSVVLPTPTRLCVTSIVDRRVDSGEVAQVKLSGWRVTAVSTRPCKSR